MDESVKRYHQKLADPQKKKKLPEDIYINYKRGKALTSQRRQQTPT